MAEKYPLITQKTKNKMNQHRFSRRKFVSTATTTLIGTFILKGCQTNSEQTAIGGGNTSSDGGVPQGISADDEEALYEAAKQEGKLVWYAVYFNQEIVDEIGKAFTKKYPGIDFEGTRNTASNLFQKLNQEAQVGLNIADIYATTDFSQMLQLKEEQKLQHYAPAGKENIVEKYRNLDPDNYYQVGAFLPIVIGYNSELISLEEAPSSWQELTSTKYEDKIATGSGAASGQVGTWALSMEQKYGWDYLVQFNQLNPKLSRSINDVVPALVAKERALGATTVGQILTRKSLGDPLDVIYPEDGAIVVVAPIAVLKEAPHPNTAKLFLNFINSPEYSEVITKYFEQPIHQEVELAGAKSLAEVNTYTPQPETISVDIPKVKEKWREEFGA